MNARIAWQTVRFTATVLLLVVAMTPGSLAQAPPFSPPDAVAGESFSVAEGSPSVSNGLHPADVLGANGLVFISCADLGLLCTDPDSGAVDELAALSFGRDFNDLHLPPVQFSVSAGAQGVVGSAVADEAACSPAQAQSDVFETTLNESNSQDLDGDGVACTTNAGLALGLNEGANIDEVDALAQDPCQVADLDCNGTPDEPVFLVLGSGSPSLVLFGATVADILVTYDGALPEIWAAGTADLGLQNGDAIDALCVEDDGDGLFGSDDNILFSLTPNSPSLVTLNAGPGALLTSQPLQVVAQARSLGLARNDDVDALACGALVVVQSNNMKSFLPVIGNEPPTQ